MSMSPFSRLSHCLSLALLALGVTAMPAAARPVQGHYIVTVKQGHDPSSVAQGVQAKPEFVYRAALNGFAGELNQGQLTALRHNPNVESIEEDQTADANATQTTDFAGNPWGLDRIDQRSLPLSRSFTYTRAGAGVHAYILDTGLQANHPDFGGRAVNEKWRGGWPFPASFYEDCNGHGTHVAGTIGGTVYGVAKAARLHGVKVLYGCDDPEGSVSGIIAGLDWVRTHHVKPAVANMSLGAGYSAMLNNAVANLVSAGVFVAVSAGNQGVSACTRSPASAPSAYTVAASDRTDQRAKFSSWTSNWGSCVDAYAPGVAIKSDFIGGSTTFMNGTSMASPHVAGVVALYKSWNDLSAATITSWLNGNATAGAVAGNPAGTANRLLYKASL